MNGKMSDDDLDCDITVESPISVVAQTANDLDDAELETTSIERVRPQSESQF